MSHLSCWSTVKLVIFQGVDVEGVDIVEGAVVSGLMEDRSKPLHEVLKG